MLAENGIDNQLLKSEPVRRRKRYKKFKTTRDFYTKGFEGISSSSDDSSNQYSTVFRCHEHTSREMIPTRVMTELESRIKHPDVPHHWLCQGKLLVLEDPKNPQNIKLFQVFFNRLLIFRSTKII